MPTYGDRESNQRDEPEGLLRVCWMQNNADDAFESHAGAATELQARDHPRPNSAPTVSCICSWNWSIKWHNRQQMHYLLPFVSQTDLPASRGTPGVLRSR